MRKLSPYRAKLHSEPKSMVLPRESLKSKIGRECIQYKYIQGVPTSLGYAKCNVLKIRKVCEQSELHLQKEQIKREKLVILMTEMGQNSKFTPFYWVKIHLALFIGSFCKRSSLRSQTFLSFRTLHLAYPKLVGTPCR